ncbi:hypothetical protein VCHA48O428_50010 [Vibrio chagasii]|nr:hypothetical protein VCHA48O428_50010 [Vibrio chagasii]
MLFITDNTITKRNYKCQIDTRQESMAREQTVQLKKEYFSLIVDFLDGLHEEVVKQEDKDRLIEATYQIADPEIFK